MKPILNLAAVVFSLASATASQAVTLVPVPGLFNTGVNNSNVVIANGAVDPHWTLVGAPTSVALGALSADGVNGANPLDGAWVSNTSTSRWINPGDALSNPPGEYFYRLSFTLTPDLIANTAQFTARYAADNNVRAINLNSTALTPTLGAFGSFTDFNAMSGFVTGLNTLTFQVRNTGMVNTATGLRVEFVSSSVVVVPEPESWAMLIAGFGLVGAGLRRRRNVAAA